MNLLVVPVTIVKFKSAFLHVQWAMNILQEISVFGQIENFWIRGFNKHQWPTKHVGYFGRACFNYELSYGQASFAAIK